MSTKKLIAVLLGCVLLLGMIPVFSLSDDGVTRVLACSDFQNPDGNAAGEKVVSAVVDAIKADGVDSVDALVACGDYDYDLTMLPSNTAAGINALREGTKAIVPDEAQKVFSQGNHDSLVGTAGMAKSGDNDPENGKYGLFVINEDDFAWMGGTREIVKGTSENLKAYLNEKLEQNYSAPIFVLSHLPLHYSLRSRNTGDGRWGEYLINVLNEAGEKGLNIIFLFGHNHSNSWDDYLGGGSICLEKGDEINVCKPGNSLAWNTHTLNFTYINAGYTGYYRDNGNGADVALTMTMFEITDTEVTVYRYDEQGRHNVGSAGVEDTYHGDVDWSPFTTVKESPTVIPLMNVKDGRPMDSMLDALTRFIMRIYEYLKKLVAVFC